MKTTYLFADASGDIALDAATLARPFLISSTNPHPFLTLGQYFTCLKRFILQDKSGLLRRVLSSDFPEFPGLDRIEEIKVRSEKHGAFYHIASIELLAGSSSCKLAVTAALGQANRGQLEEEFARLDYLNQRFKLPYLPRVYFCGRQECHTPAGTETFTMTLGEWLTGYHEWHLTVADNRQQVCLWDHDAGRCLLSEKESRQVIREAARILTLYYDPKSFAQIQSWHHAAGDFIARRSDSGIEIRLITVRGYKPLPGFSPEAGCGMEIALTLFFLDLTLQIRLDRFDGVGAVAWFEDFAVGEAVNGFLEALAAQEAAGGGIVSGFAAEFLAMLQSFTEADLAEIYGQFLAAGEGDEEEAAEMEARLKAHCRLLVQELGQISV